MKQLSKFVFVKNNNPTFHREEKQAHDVLLSSRNSHNRALQCRPTHRNHVSSAPVMKIAEFSSLAKCHV